MDYVRPSSVEDAVRLLASSGSMILSGGTDLCVYLAEGLCSPNRLIDIGDLDALCGVETITDDEGSEMIRIGAATPIAEIAASPHLPSCLRQGANAIGSPQIRNLGTIGGNICNGSPCGDTLAPLLTLDARFVLRSTAGTRIVESERFFLGPKQTVRESAELLESVLLPVPRFETVSAFRMIGNRNGQAISQVNASVCARSLDGTLSDVRVAVGSVAPIPLRLKKLEEVLTGKRIEDVRFDDIRTPVLEGIRPIDDVRSSATYRQEVTVALVFDALMACGDPVSGVGEGGR